MSQMHRDQSRQPKKQHSSRSRTGDDEGRGRHHSSRPRPREDSRDEWRRLQRGDSWFVR
jgi:hypothetical protein